jgi:hypothetical protein
MFGSKIFRLCSVGGKVLLDDGGLVFLKSVKVLFGSLQINGWRHSCLLKLETPISFTL